MGPACSGRDFCCPLGWGSGEDSSRQDWPLSGRHPDLLAHQARVQGAGPEVFSVCSLSFCFGSPHFMPPPWSTIAAGVLSRLLRFPAAAAAPSQVCQGLLLMTFLSVFQIVSNKSIPRKRPREVALSTFQTFGFPIPFSLLPCFSCLSHLL